MIRQAFQLFHAKFIRPPGNYTKGYYDGLHRGLGSFQTPERTLVEGLSVAATTSPGIRVGTESAMAFSPVWRAVSMIARDVGKLPLFVYQRIDGGGKERATTVPAYRHLRWKANPEMTAQYFKQLLTTHVLLSGNGYAFIQRDAVGQVTGLFPLEPENVDPQRDAVGGPLVYLVRRDNGSEIKLAPREVLHIRGVGWDGIAGWDVVGKGAESIAMGIAARDYGGRFFANNASAGMVLSHPGALSDIAKTNIAESVDRKVRSLQNAHRTLVLEEGMKPSKYTDTAEEAQLVELRVHQIREAANLFGVPSHRLGDPEPTSFASLEQENQQYLNDALDGWLVAWEEECRDKLLTERQKSADSHIIEFERKALIRADIKSRFDAYQLAIMNGIMSPNEARDRENMNPITDGDTYFVPQNLIPIERALEEPKPTPAPFMQPDEDEEPPEDEEDDSRQALLDDAARRICKRLWRDAKAAAKKPDTLFMDHVEAIGTRRQWVADVLSPVLSVCMNGGRDVEGRSGAVLDAFRDEMLRIADEAKPETLLAMLDGERETIEQAVQAALRG